MIAFRTLSDYELTGLLQQGDQHAFAELFQRYNRLLFVHAHKLLNDKEEAKDLVQEVFTSLWDNHANLTIKANFAGFLYTSIKNKILDKISHKKVESKYLESLQDFINKGEAQTDHLLRTKQLQSLIEMEISYLPPKMRAIFELSRKLNLSHKEIAAELNISEKTVKNQINNALKILRKKLGFFTYLLFIINHYFNLCSLLILFFKGWR
ncbi:RNA polymerase sigma factor [Solitalea lacus]|uniref:RNA polymerase sigma factor n=1 Tax=Solitalea lacus TaxID=2911172 RepID=UPI001EDB9BF0|nr:RNA polymerase sigma-70 factor [Solitalea lacus]UKJ06960.1 RNA polymerase sigma-70 factor [Solitalea lacus]